MTPSPAITKAATVAELTGIRRLVQRHVDYERSTISVSADWAERTAGLVAAGQLVVFVARVGDDAIGYTSMTTDVSTWAGEAYAHLDCLFVDQEYRGAGTGLLLMNAVAEFAREGGWLQLQWQTPEWNTGAIRFYERLGATHETKRRFALELGERGE